MNLLAFLFACYEIYNIWYKYPNINKHISALEKMVIDLKKLKNFSMNDILEVLIENKLVAIEFVADTIYLLFIIRLVFSRYFCFGIVIICFMVAQTYCNKKHEYKFLVIDSALCISMLLYIAVN